LIAATTQGEDPENLVIGKVRVEQIEAGRDRAQAKYIVRHGERPGLGAEREISPDGEPHGGEAIPQITFAPVVDGQLYRVSPLYELKGDRGHRLGRAGPDRRREQLEDSHYLMSS
jgi:hypothetical protein